MGKIVKFGDKLKQTGDATVTPQKLQVNCFIKGILDAMLANQPSFGQDWEIQIELPNGDHAKVKGARLYDDKVIILETGDVLWK